VFYAGGNALAASPHGDNLWLLGPRRELDEAGRGARGGSRRRPRRSGQPEPAHDPPAGNAAAGQTIYASNCCDVPRPHRSRRQRRPGIVTSIPSAKNYQTVVGQITNGGGGMPPFKGTLTQKEINDVATDVVKDVTHGKVPVGGGQGARVDAERVAGLEVEEVQPRRVDHVASSARPRGRSLHAPPAR